MLTTYWSGKKIVKWVFDLNLCKSLLQWNTKLKKSAACCKNCILSETKKISRDFPIANFLKENE